MLHALQRASAHQRHLRSHAQSQCRMPARVKKGELCRTVRQQRRDSPPLRCHCRCHCRYHCRYRKKMHRHRYER